jgi:DNA uptake protein ComE-like DNA-binding protein
MAIKWWPRIGQFLLGGGGFLSLLAGALFTYKTQYEHPQYRYLPADQEWRDHLKAVIEASRQRVEQASPSALMVDVAGAVAKPGVYSLSSGARVQEAILAAGGFAVAADQQYIHQELNLADSVRDKGKIYVPYAGESVAAGQTPAAGGSAAAKTIDVNVAAASALETLPGIGAKRAADIIANRPYQDAAALQEKAGLSGSVINGIIQSGYQLIY